MVGRPKAVSLGTQQKMAPPTVKENKETLDKVLKNIESLKQEFVRIVERSDKRNEIRKKFERKMGRNNDRNQVNERKA